MRSSSAINDHFGTENSPARLFFSPNSESLNLSCRVNFTLLQSIQIQTDMAQSKAASIIFVIAVFFSVAISAVSAQDSPAPAPNGAPFSMPISATVIMSSLALSLAAILKH
ncbi:hypothetical protein Nepgr_029102 [Nepenthes gracilis]|uniref:Uncharacterized protein n=1 Tax=Nepenthes gracilis TaxID=150966 RepID=A0AAD3TE49_NEPGR|nr:hypothetical protein Nepgr_029102 [Nepenthes gracilis]